MKLARLAGLGIALAVAMPIVSAHADCRTPEGQSTVQIKFRQAMAGWSMNDPTAYAAAQEQLKKDMAAVQRYATEQRDQRKCAVWQRYIKLSHTAPAPTPDAAPQE